MNIFDSSAWTGLAGAILPIGPTGLSQSVQQQQFGQNLGNIQNQLVSNNQNQLVSNNTFTSSTTATTTTIYGHTAGTNQAQVVSQSWIVPQQWNSTVMVSGGAGGAGGNLHTTNNNPTNGVPYPEVAINETDREFIFKFPCGHVHRMSFDYAFQAEEKRTAEREEDMKREYEELAKLSLEAA